MKKKLISFWIVAALMGSTHGCTQFVEQLGFKWGG